LTPVSNLSLNLTPASGAASTGLAPFVNLEQIGAPRWQRQVTIPDIYRMWFRALSDIAAGHYKASGCPVSFQRREKKNTETGETETVMYADIWLDFYALPSAEDLDYELSTNIGEIGTPEIVELPRERDIVFEMVDYYDLDFLPLSGGLEWDSACYIEDGATIPRPPLQLNSPRIVLPEKLFGVARLTAVGYARKYRLNISLEKGSASITNLEPIITAAWAGGTRQLELVVPECVRHALKLCSGDIGSFCVDDQVPQTIVYVSGCDGSTLDVRLDDPESWCKER